MPTHMPLSWYYFSCFQHPLVPDSSLFRSCLSRHDVENSQVWLLLHLWEAHTHSRFLGPLFPVLYLNAP